MELPLPINRIAAFYEANHGAGMFPGDAAAASPNWELPGDVTAAALSAKFTTCAIDFIKADEPEEAENNHNLTAPIMRLISLMVAEAVRDGASDIRIFGEVNRTSVVYQFPDGNARELDALPRRLHNSLFAMLSSLGGSNGEFVLDDQYFVGIAFDRNEFGRTALLRVKKL
jgi:hypothetical protein